MPRRRCFRGAYVGVDLFFVISGFVIAKGYLHRLVDGDTTFVQFFGRRLRRLAAASLFVVLATAAVAPFFLEPRYLIAFARSVLAQPVFGQNFVFWAEGSYFSGPLRKPLLMLGALAMAVFSYHAIENPIRRTTRVSGRTLLGTWGAAMAACVVVGAAFIGSRGLLGRYDPDVRAFHAAALEASRGRCSYMSVLFDPRAEMCALFESGPGQPAVLFVGDSHAGVLKPELREMGRRHDITVLLTVRNCDAGRYGETAFCSLAIRETVAEEARRRGVMAVVALS